MLANTQIADIYTQFSIDPVYGFLPGYTPLEKLGHTFAAWDEAAQKLPETIVAKKTGALIAALPDMPLADLHGIAEIERAFMILAHLAHAYVWEQGDMRDHIPAKVAVPFASLADQLGRPAVIHHASNVLYNWRKIDPEGDLVADNLRALIGFDDSDDEHWFYNVTTEIEAVGAPALADMIQMRLALNNSSLEERSLVLTRLHKALEAMIHSLKKMTERCRPDRFYHHIRPFVASLTEVTFEGVSENPVRSYAGGSAAQSTLIQAFDIMLGVKHPHPSGQYLLKMRDHMPPGHKAFLIWLEAAEELPKLFTEKSLEKQYAQVASSLLAFRNTHLKIVAEYIAGPARKMGGSTKGTGGTDALTFLKEVRNDMRGL